MKLLNSGTSPLFNERIKLPIINQMENFTILQELGKPRSSQALDPLERSIKCPASVMDSSTHLKSVPLRGLTWKRDKMRSMKFEFWRRSITRTSLGTKSLFMMRLQSVSALCLSLQREGIFWKSLKARNEKVRSLMKLSYGTISFRWYKESTLFMITKLSIGT